MQKSNQRRDFIKKTAAAGILLSYGTSLFGREGVPPGKRVGIIGLDTSHSIAFAKMLNDTEAAEDLMNYRVVAAYPHGSADIESSVSRIPKYIKEVEGFGVEVVSSIDALLDMVDVVLLETNDGRLHLEQVLQVFNAGKRVFIDKPIAAALPDVLKIYKASAKYGIPTFSASSLRYVKGLENVDLSKVVGADAYSPAALESTHTDLYWYGVHGVEILFTVMGVGCESVSRIHTKGTDIVTGIWKDGRIGTFRGTRTGKHGYGGTVFTDEGSIVLGPYNGYRPLLVEVVKYFETGEVPVTPEETIEMFAFMTAADVSKYRGGEMVYLDEVIREARR